MPLNLSALAPNDFIKDVPSFSEQESRGQSQGLALRQAMQQAEAVDAKRRIQTTADKVMGAIKNDDYSNQAVIDYGNADPEGLKTLMALDEKTRSATAEKLSKANTSDALYLAYSTDKAKALQDIVAARQAHGLPIPQGADPDAAQKWLMASAIGLGKVAEGYGAPVKDADTGMLKQENMLGQVKITQPPTQPKPDKVPMLDKAGTPMTVSKTVGGVRYEAVKYTDGSIGQWLRGASPAEANQPRSVTYQGVPGTLDSANVFHPATDKSGVALEGDNSGGAIGKRYTEAMRVAGAELLAEMKNVNAMMENNGVPKMSAFQDAQKKGGGTFNAMRNYLAQQATPEEATVYQAAAAGMDLALARMQNAGPPATQAQIAALRDGLKFTNADTRYTMLFKLNNARQRAMLALDKWSLGTKEQMAEVRAVADELKGGSYIPPDMLVRFKAGTVPASALQPAPVSAPELPTDIQHILSKYKAK